MASDSLSYLINVIISTARKLNALDAAQVIIDPTISPRIFDNRDILNDFILCTIRADTIPDLSSDDYKRAMSKIASLAMEYITVPRVHAREELAEHLTTLAHSRAPRMDTWTLSMQICTEFINEQTVEFTRTYRACMRDIRALASSARYSAMSRDAAIDEIVETHMPTQLLECNYVEPRECEVFGMMLKKSASVEPQESIFECIAAARYLLGLVNNDLATCVFIFEKMQRDIAQ